MKKTINVKCGQIPMFRSIESDPIGFLSRVNQRELPSFQIGMEYGIEQGIEQGEGKALIRQVQKRFGPLTEEVKDRIGSANSLQIEQWLDNILDARSLDEVFKG